MQTNAKQFETAHCKCIHIIKLHKVHDVVFDTFFVLFFFSAGRPPFGQMPFLEFGDGKILAQSGAICKFVCGLAGIST